MHLAVNLPSRPFTPFRRLVDSHRRVVLGVLALAAAVAIAVAALAPAAAGAAAPPRGFMGVTAWDELSDTQFRQLAGANVRLYRMDVLWNRVEPRPPRADGTHVYDWRYYDAMFARAARRGVRILPIVHGSPRWAASRPRYQPSSSVAKQSFDAFAREAAKRYGPSGTRWSRAPWSSASPAPASIRSDYWQVWNEPNHSGNWYPGPSPSGYATLLKRVSRALRSASPGVRVAAGLPWPAQGMNPEPYMAGMLKVAGLRESVSAFAIHPYGKLPFNVMQRVKSARSALNANGASSKPMWVTEIGWASGTYDGSWTVSESQQARNLDGLYKELLASRVSLKLLGAVWFSYQDHVRQPGEADYWGFRSGLLRANGSAKPSWTIFAKRARYGY